MNYRFYNYFVEGDCEKHLIRQNQQLKNQYFFSGRVETFNILNKLITDTKLRTIKDNTLLVFVFDTDINIDLTILKRNIKKLNSYKAKYIFILQDKNFEDEIVRSTDIKRIKDLFKSLDDSDFKGDFIKCKYVFSTLEKHKFDINKFRIYKNENPYFKDYKSEGNKIKKRLT